MYTQFSASPKKRQNPFSLSRLLKQRIFSVSTVDSTIKEENFTVEVQPNFTRSDVI